MSKAIEGLAMIGGAIALGVAAFALASTGVGFAALPFLLHASAALAIGGLTMEAAAATSALTAQRGGGITLRQVAGYRQIIRGQRRVGGVIIFRSTTGGSKRQLNYVIVIGGEPIWALPNLYLDGRQVFWDVGSHGNATQNGYNFGGSANGNTYTGPSGVQYNFGGLVYCEARYGNQLSGDVLTSLTANDPTWAAGADGNPYVGGCTYVYLKVEQDDTVFPNEPEVKFTAMGRPVYDPRSGETTYTANPALHAADHLADTTFGVGDSYINADQLVAAANICDEQVPLAAGGTEARYAMHWNYDTSMSPGNALVTMMESMAGRCRNIGGEWWIFPGAWLGPSLSFDHNQLAGKIDWNPIQGIDRLCNMITGTYIAPNFPYNIAGNLYDSNGFYQGQIQNNFAFAYQPTNAPQYARDTAHGYASNIDLDADSGVMGAWDSGTTYSEGAVVSFNGTIWVSRADANFGNQPAPATGTEDPTQMPWTLGALYLPLDLQLQTVCSVSQAQRLFKIEYMRRRYMGKGELPMQLAGYAAQSLDVLTFTAPELNWAGKVLELDQPVLRAVETRNPDGSQGEPAMQVLFPVSETGPDIYAWQVAEEQNVYSQQIIAGAKVS